MVDVMGHIAFGLLFAVPAWFLWSGRASAAFVGMAAVTAILPDMDVWLSKFFPNSVHHHGVTHTVVFVVLGGLVLAGIVTVLLRGPIDDWVESKRFDTWSLYGFSLTAILVGGLSHIFADLLSAPDISTPIEPFWPFFDKWWSVDLVWYNARWINLGFLTVMVLVHLGLAYYALPANHRFRLAS